MRPDDGGYYLLDELGSLVWELCDATRTIADVISTVADQCEMPVAQAAGEVREWIAELRLEGLLAAPA